MPLDIFVFNHYSRLRRAFAAGCRPSLGQQAGAPLWVSSAAPRCYGHRLWCADTSSCGTQWPRSMRDRPGPGTGPVFNWTCSGRQILHHQTTREAASVLPYVPVPLSGVSHFQSFLSKYLSISSNLKCLWCLWCTMICAIRKEKHAAKQSKTCYCVWDGSQFLRHKMWMGMCIWNNEIWSLPIQVRLPSVKVTRLCPTPHLHGLWNSPGQNTGVGNRPLLQGISPTQGLDPGLPHCRRILYQLSQQGRLGRPHLSVCDPAWARASAQALAPPLRVMVLPLLTLPLRLTGAFSETEQDNSCKAPSSVSATTVNPHDCSMYYY